MTTKGKRILLAEDEVTLRDFIRRNLHARGFEVVEANNGLEAVALWERENPHLLILDIMMPRMDGLEVCRRVREHSAVPIIVLTALDDESDKVAAPRSWRRRLFDKAIWSRRIAGAGASSVTSYSRRNTLTRERLKTIWRHRD